MFSKSLNVNEALAEYLRSHGRKNTLLDGKRRSETLKRKDISFLKDVISLSSLSHCVVCHPAICPSQAEFRSHCCPHISNLAGKLYDHVFSRTNNEALSAGSFFSFLLSLYSLSVDKIRKEN